MEYVVLSNGVRMPMIGMGGWAQKEENILQAFREGYCMIDTASQYGNEAEIGRAIQKSGISRENLFISTKLWTEDIRKGMIGLALEESLKRLGLDQVDLYLIHWPAEGYERAWLEMERLYQEGKARAIGVCNFEPHHLDSLERGGAKIKPMVNQVESHPYFSNQFVLETSWEKGIYPEAWCPLGGPGSEELKDRKIIRIAEEHKKTPAQIVLRWHIQRGVISIPKTSRLERMRENMGVFDFELSAEEMGAIKELECGKRLGAHPDFFDF